MHRTTLSICFCIAAPFIAPTAQAQDAEPKPDAPPATTSGEPATPPAEPRTRNGDVLHIPLSQQGEPGIPLPARGLTMTAVREQFGEPQSTGATVGKPPITRWEYGQFTVTFEADRVIQSVRKHQPKHPVQGQ